MNTRQFACSAIAATIALAFSAPSWAVTAEEHAAHHPDQVAAAASAAPNAGTSSAKTKAAKPASSKTSTAKKGDQSASAPSTPNGMCMPMGMTPQMSQALDKQMQSMSEMHDKMMAAKSTDEKRALLGVQIKTMQDGMAMMDQMGKMGPAGSGGPGMGGMSGMGGMASSAPAASAASSAGGMGGMGGMGCMGGMHAQHDMMGKRMQMMESMMRLMMDRLSVEPAK